MHQGSAFPTCGAEPWGGRRRGLLGAPEGLGRPALLFLASLRALPQCKGVEGGRTAGPPAARSQLCAQTATRGAWLPSSAVARPSTELPPASSHPATAGSRRQSHPLGPAAGPSSRGGRRARAAPCPPWACLAPDSESPPNQTQRSGSVNPLPTCRTQVLWLFL